MKLWSHQVAQDIAAGSPAVNPEVQEALSRRYSASSLIVLPLRRSPGRFAIFGPDGQLIEIANGPLQSELLLQLSADGESRAKARRDAAPPAGASSRATTKSSADLFGA